jgi:hypothetical protein
MLKVENNWLLQQILHLIVGFLLLKNGELKQYLLCL